MYKVYLFETVLRFLYKLGENLGTFYHNRGIIIFQLQYVTSKRQTIIDIDNDPVNKIEYI